MPEKSLKYYQFPKELDYMLSLAIGTENPQLPELKWELFHRFLEKNRVETLVSSKMAKYKDIPVEVQSLHKRRQELTVKTMKQMRVLAVLAGLYQQAEIQMLTMKGPLLAAELYGDPSLRYSNDLDLLVREEDFPRAKEILLENGFLQYIPITKSTELRKKKSDFGEEMHEIFFKDDVQVELHWRISFRYPVQFEELWQCRQSRMLLGQEIFCLGKEDNLIYLISHAAGHCYSRLRWLLDIYQLFRKEQMDFAELYRQMEKRSAGMFLLETLLILYRMPYMQLQVCSSELFSIEKGMDEICFRYHPSIKDVAEKAMKLAKLADRMICSSTTSIAEVDRKYIRLVPVVGRENAAGVYLKKMFTPQAVDMERFDLPDRLYFLYYIIRPFYKLWRMTPFYKKTEP